ncbi:hypothetical protein [Streptomyces cavernicola]|uniref:Transcriptional regulator n=1 Tax=Streptomyces cavernicola TaxID=3043613 RepID=A0ABT6SLL6_9ACTN|nr:hypothetical protein [Streptomyces sp. B-S-A6]MDI3408814.1 hypothetical protein [Streptomyces sp. B-S-A6]
MTEPNEAARIAALSELIAWAERRERLSADRADAVAAAWRTGTRNVAELARLARVTRDTVYADLAARGVDHRSREQQASGPPKAGATPLRGDSVRTVAKVADAVARPASTHDPDDPLVRVTLAAARALEGVADVLEPPTDQGPGWTPRETLPGLAGEGEKIAHHSHRALAALAERGELAASSEDERKALLHTGRRAVADGASVALTLPTGEVVTLQLGRDEAGLTTLTSDSPLVTGDIDGLDHLEAQAALQTLARIATRHLAEAALTEHRKDTPPGTRPRIRTRTIPSNED